ncbi:MAG TPA: hypothetical protein PKK12_05375, partial [Candidatus Aminicenantes bacterium]|nr:hypothetical protein [Candidatus Aminicenantes bacterium]
MNPKTRILPILLMLVVCAGVLAAQTAQLVDSVLLSNEGGLVDDLIAAGHGGKSLFQVVQLLAPLSDGAIPQSFVDTLAGRPAGSQVFVQTLGLYAGETRTLGILATGEVLLRTLYAMNPAQEWWLSLAWREGYQTLPGGNVGGIVPLFTTYLRPSSPIPYSYSSDGSKCYRAWALVWNRANAPTTFVLSNEGGLIDGLIAAGHGSDTLLQVLTLLAPDSGGAIPQPFLDTLAACPADSEVKTAPLSNYTGLNNPVCVNSDGHLTVNDIFAADYSGQAGYRDVPGDAVGAGTVQITQALRPDRYPDAGSIGSTHYYAFAIAWASAQKPTTVVLSNEGGLIDGLVAAGHGGKSLYQIMLLLQPLAGGAIPQSFVDALASCPAGSDVLTEPLTTFAAPANNPICINTDGSAYVASLFGKDYSFRAGFTTFAGEKVGTVVPTFIMARGPDQYIDAGSGSGSGSYRAFTIVCSLQDAPDTIVVSNEAPGYLIDQLIAAGHGAKTLLETLQFLQPRSGGAIPAWFLDALAGCPDESDAKTVPLSIFAGLNGPVVVYVDGWMSILPAFGHDFHGEPGYTTTEGTPVGSAAFRTTTADDPGHYIDGGCYDLDCGNRYRIFAIAWATAVPENHTVSFLAGSGGTISGTSSQVVPGGGSTTAVTAVPNNGYHFVNWTGTGFATSTANPLTVSNVTSDLTITANFGSSTPPAIGLNHSRLNYGKVGAAITSAQTLRIRNTGGGTLSWTATPSASWIVLDKTSGSGNARVQVSVNATGLGNGIYNGTITVTDPAASNSPQAVQVSLVVKNSGASPFGTFETPAAGATGVTGNVAVTGWVVDDVEVATVKIYRSPLAGEGTARVFIGDANLVEGARPDVEALYASYPWSYRSGW